jgi:hypothetical protein
MQISVDINRLHRSSLKFGAPELERSVHMHRSLVTEHGGILKEASGDQVVVQTSLASTVHPGRAGTSHVARGREHWPKESNFNSILIWGLQCIFGSFCSITIHLIIV